MIEVCPGALVVGNHSFLVYRILTVVQASKALDVPRIQFGLLIYKTFDSEGEVHVLFANIKVEFAGDATLFDK